MRRIRLALFPDPLLAAPVRNQLVEAGVAAEIHHELQLQRLWFVSTKAAGARVEVGIDQWEQATSLLRQWDAETRMLRNAIRCPECRSLRVDYPQYTPKSFLTNLAIGLMAELRLIERQYYCEECHCMWSKKKIKSRPPRPHQAPNYFIEGM
jgi:hypothetical protein